MKRGYGAVSIGAPRLYRRLSDAAFVLLLLSLVRAFIALLGVESINSNPVTESEPSKAPGTVISRLMGKATPPVTTGGIVALLGRLFYKQT